MPLKSESQHKQRMRNGAALLCCMSVVAFITFAAIDPLMNSGHLYTLFTVRAVLVVGGLCFLALAVRGPAFTRPNAIGVAICLWTGGGVIVLNRPHRRERECLLDNGHGHVLRHVSNSTHPPAPGATHLQCCRTILYFLDVAARCHGFLRRLGCK